MVLALAACGGNTTTETKATEAAAETKAAAVEAPAEESTGLIKVGIINNDPNESGYRTANDKDMKATFTEENGYDASFAYSLKNEEQIAAAQKFIQDEVDYLLISAAGTSGWDTVLKDAQDAGIQVILFDRTIDADDSLYVASIVSDMAKEDQTAGIKPFDFTIHKGNVIGTFFGVLSLNTIKNIVSSLGLDEAWWTNITVAAMICLFLLIQSIVLMRKNKK